MLTRRYSSYTFPNSSLRESSACGIGLNGAHISRDVDFLRQGRHWHAVQTGTLKERADNKEEQIFDRIAANGPLSL